MARLLVQLKLRLPLLTLVSFALAAGFLGLAVDLAGIGAGLEPPRAGRRPRPGQRPGSPENQTGRDHRPCTRRRNWARLPAIDKQASHGAVPAG